MTENAGRGAERGGGAGTPGTGEAPGESEEAAGASDGGGLPAGAGAFDEDGLPAGVSVSGEDGRSGGGRVSGGARVPGGGRVPGGSRVSGGDSDSARAERIATLAERVRGLARDGQRVMVGITGAPGAGKSTLATALVDALAPDAALVGMDGFHLAQRVLDELGRASRKGAIDTFDAGGYVTLLRRLRARDEDVVYAPEFRREIEEPIAGAVAVPREVPIVITEGNYLLADGAWEPVRDLLDEVWFVDVPDDVRLTWLMARHRSFGESPERAQQHALGSDQANAELVASLRDRATVVIAP